MRHRRSNFYNRIPKEILLSRCKPCKPIIVLSLWEKQLNERIKLISKSLKNKSLNFKQKQVILITLKRLIQIRTKSRKKAVVKKYDPPIKFIRFMRKA